MKTMFNRMKSGALTAAKFFGSHRIQEVLDELKVPKEASLNKRFAKVTESDYGAVVKAVQALGKEATKTTTEAAKDAPAKAKAAPKKIAKKAKDAVTRPKRSETPPLDIGDTPLPSHLASSGRSVGNCRPANGQRPWPWPWHPDHGSASD